MQRERRQGPGANQQTLSSEHDPAAAAPELVTAGTAYEKLRIEVRRATGMILESCGISIADAINGTVEADNHQ
jgi:hypothetical protein